MSGATSWLQVARGKCSRSNYWGEWDPAPVERVGHSVCTDWADALRGQAVQRVGLVRLKGAKDLHTAHLRTCARYVTAPHPHQRHTMSPQQTEEKTTHSTDRIAPHTHTPVTRPQAKV